MMKYHSFCIRVNEMQNMNNKTGLVDSKLVSHNDFNVVDCF